MRRGFHTLLAMVVVGVGGLASGVLAPASVATPKGQHQVASQAGVAKRHTAVTKVTTRLVGDLKKSGFWVKRGYPMLYPLDACIKYTFHCLAAASVTIPRLRM